MITATIPAASIQDTWLNSSNSFTNYSTNTTAVYVGNGNLYRSVVRFDQTLIPAGTITGMRFYAWYYQGDGGTIVANVIKDANAWVYATCCWAKQKTSTNWAGSAGCNTDGTDYDTDASPPTIVNLQINQYTPMVLLPATATAWRDGTRINNGIVLSSLDTIARYYPTEYTTVGNRPYFEIDYDPPTVSAKSLFFRIPF